MKGKNSLNADRTNQADQRDKKSFDLFAKVSSDPALSARSGLSAFKLLSTKTPARLYCEIALKNSGNVANDCPRYCGRKPKRMILPLPYVTSTSAAFPAILSAPSAQPDSNIFVGSEG